MIRAMNILSIIMMLFCTISCNQSADNGKASLNRIEVEPRDPSKIDSVILKYWKSTEANTYIFRCSNEVLQIKSEYFGFEKNIRAKHIKEEFFNYVNDLYFGKEPIILSTKKEPSPVTDYPTIEAIGYLKDKKIFEEKTTLYMNKEFNPKFLKFYIFLDSLVKKN